MGQEKCPDKLSAALQQGIVLVWEDVSDFVNPFGDRRGCLFNSVWTFDLDKDMLLLTKSDGFYSTPLELARKRLLSLHGFKLLSSPKQSFLEEQTLPGPYWEPKLDPPQRARSFLGQILRDFSYTWRHVLRREMNTVTFMKLAYATIWISQLEFMVVERVRLEHISSGWPYVDVVDLPSWEAPKATLVWAGASWFVLTQDTREGLEMIRCHMSSQSVFGVRIYAILTLRHIVPCKTHGSEILWTRSETLFDDIPISNAAIDMILWATNTTSNEPKTSSISLLPVEIQDRVLYYATTSLVASAKLGYELGLGSPFTWMDNGLWVSLQEIKRHREESSPVESQISFDGAMSGLSYKRERGDRVIPASRMRLQYQHLRIY